MEAIEHNPISLEDLLEAINDLKKDNQEIRKLNKDTRDDHRKDHESLQSQFNEKMEGIYKKFDILSSNVEDVVVAYQNVKGFGKIGKYLFGGIAMTAAFAFTIKQLFSH